MTQVNWQLTPDQVAGYVVTATNWNDVASDLRAFIDQTTSSASDNTPLPLGIDLVNDRVYISDPDTTTPEDGNHADTTLSVVGTTTLNGNTQQTGTFTVGEDDTGFDVQFFGAATGKHLLFDQDENALKLVDIDLRISGNSTSEIKNVTTSGPDRFYLSIRADEDGVSDGAGINLYKDTDPTNPDKIIFYTGGDSTMTLDGDDAAIVGDLTVGGGDINLGTTTAAETLNVAGVTTASGAGSNLKVKGGDATGTNQSGAWLILQSGLGTGSGASGDILFYTGPAGGSGASQNTATKVMTCKSDGDVTMENSLGIGTGSPDRALEVEGAFGGYGIHIDSSTGAGIEIDRGASSNSHGVLFQTAGVDNWYIGNYNDGDALVIKDGKWDGTEIAAFTPTGLGIGTAAPGWSVDVEAAAQARIRVQGGGTGYTQANILLESSTSDDPEDRGLGIYYWNRGTDQTWYTGVPYSNSTSNDRWCISRVPASGFQEAAAAAASSYTLVTVDTTGMVIGGTVATAPLDISDFSGYISTPALRFTNTDTTVSVPNTIGKIEFYNSDSGGAGVNAQISAYAFDNAGATALEFEVGDNDTLITPLMLKPEGGNHASVPMLADFGGYSTVYIGWRLGIGTGTPAYKLDVDGDINYTGGSSIYYDTADAADSVAFRIDAGNRDVSIFRVSTDTWSTSGDYGATLKYMGTRTGNNNSLSIFMDNQTGTQVEAMTILQDGNVGIGTAAATYPLTVAGETGVVVGGYTSMGRTKSGAMSIFGHNVHVNSAVNNQVLSTNSGYYGQMIKMYYNEGITFHVVNATVTAGNAFYTGGGTTNEVMRITNAGLVGIGTATPNNTLDVIGDLFVGDTSRNYTGHAQYGGLCFPRGEILFSNTNGQNQMYFCSNLTMTATGGFVAINTGMSSFMAADNGTINIGTAPSASAGAAPSFTTRLTIANTGLVSVGAMSKTSGTFDIPHPTRGGDWRLRHSFIEGPQADLIYRGTVTLSGGTGTVDLDAVSHMTDGTWEALCRDPWAMVASSGNAVEWSLSGKTLTITSDTADAVCSWMVIAERQDDHMKSAEGVLADDDGHIIVEYEEAEPPAPLPLAEEAA